MFLSFKKYYFYLFIIIFPTLFAKNSRIKSVNNYVNDPIKENIKNLNADDKNYKYVIFDVSNCFWKPSLYDILMSLKKNVKISFKGYLDLLQCGVSFALGNLDAKKGYETFFKYLKEMDQNEVNEKCNLVWEQDCKNFIYKDAYKYFKRHKKNGLITIAVDAGITPMYKEFIKHYKFDYIFSSDLEFKDGFSTGKLSNEPCSNKAKYDVVRELIEDKLNGSLEDAIFYANSHNDIPLLEKVGKPVAVNPNKKLVKKAGRDNWPVLYFLKTRKTKKAQ
jgi:HAD superfamily phosphoserine phosphatase-like hydrolase